MGANQSRSYTKLQNIVRSNVQTSIKVDSSASSSTNASQKLTISGNVGGEVPDITQIQSVRVNIKSINKTESTNTFKNTLETDLKEKVNQAMQAGSGVGNAQLSSTVQQSINDFTFNASRAFSDAVSLIQNAEQEINITDNVDQKVQKVKQVQSIEAIADVLTENIMSDANLQESKAKLEKVLDQKQDGIAGIFSSLTGPLVVIMIIAIVGVIGYVLFKVL